MKRYPALIIVRWIFFLMGLVYLVTSPLPIVEVYNEIRQEKYDNEQLNNQRVAAGMDELPRDENWDKIRKGLSMFGMFLSWTFALGCIATAEFIKLMINIETNTRKAASNKPPVPKSARQAEYDPRALAAQLRT